MSIIESLERFFFKSNSFTKFLFVNYVKKFHDRIISEIEVVVLLNDR